MLAIVFSDPFFAMVITTVFFLYASSYSGLVVLLDIAL